MLFVFVSFLGLQLCAQDSSGRKLSKADKKAANRQRINAIIKQYLDIDVTLNRTDTQALADALREVRR